MKLPNFLFTLFIAVFLSFSSGCALVKNYQDSQQQNRLDAQLKKSNYLALKRDIATNKLSNGTMADDLKKRYGPADNIFYSSSSISSFQIWTYDIGKNKLSDTALTPIILYLENDKLVNWKY